MAVRTGILVVTGAEADQNLIAPRPEAVVGQPASEASRRGIDLDVTDTGTAGLQTPVAWLRGEHGSRKGIRRRNQQARAKAEDKRGDVSWPPSWPVLQANAALFMAQFIVAADP